MNLTKITNKCAKVDKVNTVVNVKVKYIRPHGFHDLEKWMVEPNNVYIGRRGVVFINKERFPKQSSPWANGVFN